MTEVKGPKRFVVGVYCLLPVWSPPCEAEGLLAVAVGHAFHGTLPRRFTQRRCRGLPPESCSGQARTRRDS